MFVAVAMAGYQSTITSLLSVNMPSLTSATGHSERLKRSSAGLFIEKLGSHALWFPVRCGWSAGGWLLLRAASAGNVRLRLVLHHTSRDLMQNAASLLRLLR